MRELQGRMEDGILNGESMTLDADLDAFCREEYPRLVGSLTLYCGDPYLAQELAQDALAKVCRDWSKVSRMAAPGAWAHQVAINLANSFFRRRAAERRANERLAAGASGTHIDADPATALTVRAAVGSLPRRQRTALVLRYFAGFSTMEIAAAMDCPDSSVRRLIHTAVASLRRRGALAESAEVE